MVDADKCNLCMACIPPCPTGSIDNWRRVLRVRAYSVAEQLGWDVLPAELPAEQLRDTGAPAPQAAPAAPPASDGTGRDGVLERRLQRHAAAVVGRARVHQPVRSRRSPTTATVVGNFRVTEVGREYDTHHIMLDFGAMPFPVLEGAVDRHRAAAAPMRRADRTMRASIRSPARATASGPGYNNLSLTVKRVLEDDEGRPVRGVASNYLCDLKVGDTVQVIGPFGISFLMPNHPRSNVVMICTGTGSAPMRAMTEWRRPLRASASSRAAS